jgi:hypothetical protein
MIYLMGSLKNPKVPDIANALRKNGFDVFDEWFAAGPSADKHWKAYAQGRGLNYRDALSLPFVETAYGFDWNHLVMCKAGVLVMPAGKSAHIELGLYRGWGKPCWMLHEGEPQGEDWELMPKIATGMAYSVEELVAMLTNYKGVL